MNAIDTLRNRIEHGYLEPGPLYSEALDALAKLDTLLQAAERTVSVVAQYLDTGRGDLDGWADALAAAVRDVKGDTT